MADVEDKEKAEKLAANRKRVCMRFSDFVYVLILEPLNAYS